MISDTGRDERVGELQEKGSAHAQQQQGLTVDPPHHASRREKSGTFAWST
jgi:hypothetical protein